VDWKLELAKIEFDLPDKKSFPDLAAKALEEDSDTPSLRILAGLEPDNVWDVDKYVAKTLQELHIDPPTEIDSAWLLIEYYIDKIMNREIDPHEGIHLVIHDVYYRTSWAGKNKVYVGDAIGIEELLGLCDTFDDLSVTDHRWDKTKTNDELLQELREKIIEAAARYKETYLVQRSADPDRQETAPASR
jgi:hypothetical protein